MFQPPSSFTNRLTQALVTENLCGLDTCLQEMVDKDKHFLKKFRIENTLDSILHLTVRTKSVANLRTVLKFVDYLDLYAKNHKQEYTCLCLACTIDEIPLDVVRILVETDPKLVNCPAANEIFPLHLAVQHHRLDIVKALVERNSFLNRQNIFKETALHYAAFRVDDTIRYNYYQLSYDTENVAVMEFLVKEVGACVNIEDMNGKIPVRIIEDTVVDCDEGDVVQYYEYLRDCLQIFMPFEGFYDFQYIFKFLYLAIKAGKFETGQSFIERYYLDPAYNPHKHKLVMNFVKELQPRGHTLYLCLVLHDDYKTFHENLRDYIRVLSCNDTFLESLTTIFRTAIGYDTKEQILKNILFELQNTGIDFSSWTLAQKLALLNADPQNLQQTFDLFKLLFNLNLGINFNAAGIEFIEKFCSGGTTTDCHFMVELLLPFTSHIFIDHYSLIEDLNLMEHVLATENQTYFFQKLTHFNEYFTYTCSHTLTQYSTNFTFVVHSLKQMCRNKIRQRIFNRKCGGLSDNEFVSSVMELPGVPQVLKKYLRYMDHLQFLNL